MSRDLFFEYVCSVVQNPLGLVNLLLQSLTSVIYFAMTWVQGILKRYHSWQDSNSRHSVLKLEMLLLDQQYLPCVYVIVLYTNYMSCPITEIKEYIIIIRK